MKGNNDILPVTKPEIIQNIYEQYLEAGSDIIETCTFGANAVTQADYHMQEYVKEMNICASKLGKESCKKYTEKNPEKPRFLAGSIGPCNKTASISPSVDDPSARNISFDELVYIYIYYYYYIFI